MPANVGTDPVCYYFYSFSFKTSILTTSICRNDSILWRDMKEFKLSSGPLITLYFSSPVLASPFPYIVFTVSHSQICELQYDSWATRQLIVALFSLHFLEQCSYLQRINARVLLLPLFSKEHLPTQIIIIFVQFSCVSQNYRHLSLFCWSQACEI